MDSVLILFRCCSDYQRQMISVDLRQVSPPTAQCGFLTLQMSSYRSGLRKPTFLFIFCLIRDIYSFAFVE